MSTLVAASASKPATLKFFILIVLTISGLQGHSILNAQSPDNIVATVNARKITQLEVDRSVIAKLSPLQQQIYDLRKTALENLIIRIVLEDEAKTRGISVDDLKRELTAAKVEVTQTEVEQSYAENFSAFGTMSPDEAKERLRLDLESKARMRNYRDTLSKLRSSSLVESMLAEPTLPTEASVAGAPARGRNAAPVTIIEFSDFQCPYCRQIQATLLNLSRTYGDQLKFVFKYLPLPIHADAFLAAKAAVCAGAQNKFWEYHDALFVADSLRLEALSKTAANLGLDTRAFKKCIDSAAADSKVLKDMEEARQLGINGTPSFIVNGTLYRGGLSLEDFAAIVDHKLTLAKTPSPQD